MVKLIIWIIRLVAMMALGYGLYHVIHFKFERLRTGSSEFPIKFATMAEREKQLLCLTKNIYFEAAGEHFEGKVAVAQVTLNRVNSGKFPNDICEVVFQKHVALNKIVCQFSWYCEPGPKIVKRNPAFIESEEVAKKVLLENYRLPSLHSAMYYHADYVKPNWNLPKITKIGKHIFYGEKT